MKVNKKVCKTCNKLKYIWAYGNCKYCDAKKKQYKIPVKSEKRKADDKVYSKLRKDFLKFNTICPVTRLKATEVHHTYSGKDRNKYYLITSTWLAVSRKGHNWIHENPKEARKKGWLK